MIYMYLLLKSAIIKEKSRYILHWNSWKEIAFIWLTYKKAAKKMVVFMQPMNINLNFNDLKRRFLWKAPKTATKTLSVSWIFQSNMFSRIDLNILLNIIKAIIHISKWLVFSYLKLFHSKITFPFHTCSLEMNWSSPMKKLKK